MAFKEAKLDAIYRELRNLRKDTSKKARKIMFSCISAFILAFFNTKIFIKFTLLPNAFIYKDLDVYV